MQINYQLLLCIGSIVSKQRNRLLIFRKWPVKQQSLSEVINAKVTQGCRKTQPRPWKLFREQQGYPKRVYCTILHERRSKCFCTFFTLFIYFNFFKTTSLFYKVTFLCDADVRQNQLLLLQAFNVSNKNTYKRENLS